MRSFAKVVSALSMSLSLSACWIIFPSAPSPTTATFSKQLRDPDGDGFMTSPECDPTQPQPICMAGPWIEDPGCVVTPNPDGCAVIAWEQTITTDNDWNSWYVTCETCLDAAGDQVGDTQCEEQAAPPSTCYMVDDACWECVTDEGDGFVTCLAPTIPCDEDSDCEEGEGCIVYPSPECPPNALCAPYAESGVCGVTPPSSEGCAQHQSAAGCEEDAGCDWLQDPDAVCVTEPCDVGACVEATPSEDPCTSHGDQDSCNSDASGFCAWMADPTVVCVTEPCEASSCQFVGCGDLAQP